MAPRHATAPKIRGEGRATGLRPSLPAVLPRQGRRYHSEIADADHILATQLSLANLGKLPERVARPTYARADLSPGILHFGIGNFHRAHLQVYLDRLMNERGTSPSSAPA